MRNSAERIKFISDYVFSYENKIKELNKQGLFDAAKMFELFAAKVGQLYLGLSKPFINLNIETSTFPCVDLFSEDGNIFCQVSTAKNIKSKIAMTLSKVNDTKCEKLKSIKEVFFIVLNNESINKVNDVTVGNINFIKSKNLITTTNIIEKAKNDLDFQERLYFLLKKEDDLFKSDFEKFQEAISYDSKVILDDIDEFINKKYYIDLSAQINEINSSDNRFMLISGEAGSGKSVLCKKLLENKKNVLCSRAEKLVEEGDVNKIWNFNIKDTIGLVKDDVYIYIDALEFIADNRNRLDVLDSLLKRLNDLDNAYFLCSCRTSDLASFIKTITKYNIVEYRTKPVNKTILNGISEKLPILSKIISDSKYDSLLVNPFYINFLTKFNNFKSIEDENQLRKKIWKEIICSNDDSVEPIITKIVLERATKFILYSNASNYDKNIIDKLISNGILIKNENGIRLKYDIFEDICFEQYIDNIFDVSKGDYTRFFKKLEDIGRCIYRRYQIWIENKLFSKTNRKKFLYTLIFTESIPEFWAQQSIIGIIKSTYCHELFEEYSSEIIDNNLLIKFINITNIYGFEIDSVSYNIGTFVLKNKGFGRNALIKIIYENEIFKTDLKNENSIKKLIFDYTNLLTDENTSKYSFEILKYYVDKTLKSDYLYDLVKKEIESIYKLQNVADNWIKKFFLSLRSYINNKNENKIDFANNAIKDILSMNCLCLIENYTSCIIEFYDLYYTTIIEKRNPFYQHCCDDLNKNALFGLNDNADNYEYENINKKPKYINSIFGLLMKSFWPTFEWYLEFTNKCINTFKTKSKINSYKIYFSRDSIKEYFGTNEMWMTGEYPNNMPTLLSDMTFIVKSTIIELLKNFDETKKNAFANNIKEMIYKKSNNIIGLSIIANIGLTFFKELPGYCLELISSLEIVIADLHRYAITIDNPTRKMLEKEMARKIGLLDLFMDKYNSINPNSELRSYGLLTQLYFPHLKAKCFEIFDYLYSFIFNDEEHALLYLQLQQMDIRNTSVDKIDSQRFRIVPKIDGAAKKISNIADEKNKSTAIILEKCNQVTNSLINKTATFEKIDEFINDVLEYEDEQLIFQFTNILFACISYTLSKLTIDNNKRNHYCLLWIKYAKKQLNNEPILIDANLYEFLFNQLNEGIDITIKNELKRIILNLLISENNNSDAKYQISNVAKKFLLSNKKYGTLYLNTIFLLAEDEMNHQKYNYNYLRKYYNNEKKNFIPNMQPRLQGVDQYIKQDGRKQFVSKRDKIIKKYLLEEEDYNYSNMDIKNLDIRIISHAFSCGLDLNKLTDKAFTSSYLKQLIEIYSKNLYRSYDIIGYEKYEVEKFFQNCLLDKNIYASTLNILFDQVDFCKFTSQTVDFYLNILASMTWYYFNSYARKDHRKHVENVIRLMEKYINDISVEWIKKELTIALFLGFSRFGGNADWSKYKTNYEYHDKNFLNEMFSKYGYLHFNDLLNVVCHLQYEKLLPEILISIYNSLKKYIELNNKEANKIENLTYCINRIMYYSFVKFESEIKGDLDLINAFEGILSLLIELKDEQAAVLLDEFRIH